MQNYDNDVFHFSFYVLYPRRHIRPEEFVILHDIMRFKKPAMEQQGVCGYKGSMSPDSGDLD